MRTKVLIVDDSAYTRQMIKRIIEQDPNLEVAGIASDGIDAMAKTLRLKPDIITLDFEMPEMDGFSFLRWLMRERPTPVIMVSSYGDSRTVFKALELGAVDFIAKPTKRASVELHAIERDLIRKVRGIRRRLSCVGRFILGLGLTPWHDARQPSPAAPAYRRAVTPEAVPTRSYS